MKKMNHIKKQSEHKEEDVARESVEDSIEHRIPWLLLGLFGAFAAYWLGSFSIGLTVSLTMLVNLTIAPVLAVLIHTMLYWRHTDPALAQGRWRRSCRM